MWTNWPTAVEILRTETVVSHPCDLAQSRQLLQITLNMKRHRYGSADSTEFSLILNPICFMYVGSSTSNMYQPKLLHVWVTTIAQNGTEVATAFQGTGSFWNRFSIRQVSQKWNFSTKNLVLRSWRAFTFLRKQSQLILTDAGMLLRGVIDCEDPGQAPDHRKPTLHIEYRLPAPKVS